MKKLLFLSVFLMGGLVSTIKCADPDSLAGLTPEQLLDLGLKAPDHPGVVDTAAAASAPEESGLTEDDVLRRLHAPVSPNSPDPLTREELSRLQELVRHRTPGGSPFGSPSTAGRYRGARGVGKRTRGRASTVRRRLDFSKPDKR